MKPQTKSKLILVLFLLIPSVLYAQCDTWALYLCQHEAEIRYDDRMEACDATRDSCLNACTSILGCATCIGAHFACELGASSERSSRYCQCEAQHCTWSENCG